MKTLKICICLILLLSCDHIETSQKEAQPQTYLYEIEELKKLYTQGFDLALDVIDKKMPYSKKMDPYQMGEELMLDIVNAIAEELIDFENNGENEFLIGFESFIGLNSNSQAREHRDSPDWGEYFSSGQKEILNPFMNALERADNPVQAKNMAHSFENQIINSSSLNYEEKISLLSISSGTIVYSDFVLNDGIERIKESLVTNYEDQVQTFGCSVDTRSVFAGAVASGALAGGAGFKVGCGGGMVAGPIGAATGCVGGAVMGFASGFMWGAIGGTAASLLTSCFR